MIPVVPPGEMIHDALQVVMNGTVLGREINQVAVVVVRNGYGEVSDLVDEGSGGSPEVSGKTETSEELLSPFCSPIIKG